MIVNVFGDSLSAKRKENGSILEWPALLNDKLKVKNFSKPFQTSNSLKAFHGLEGFCIINLGLVDCAERRFNRLEHKILARLPSTLVSILVKLLKRSPSLKRAYVAENKFIHNIESFIQNNQKLNLVIMSIISGSEACDLSDITRSQISAYNLALKKLSHRMGIDFLDVNSSLDSDCFMVDGYHLSAKGHKLLSNLIGEYFENIC